MKNRFSIVVFVAVLAGAGYYAFKHFRSSTQNQPKVTAFVTDETEEGLFVADGFSAQPNQENTGPTREEIECENYNQHILCKTFSLPLKKDSYEVKLNKAVIELVLDVSPFTKEASDLLGSEATAEELAILSYALLAKRFYDAERSYYLMGFSGVFTVKLFEGGKAKNVFAFMAPGAELVNFTNDLVTGLEDFQKDKDRQYLSGAKARLSKVILLRENFELKFKPKTRP